MTNDRSDLGARLKAIRAQHGWRIADVSRMTGMAASTISKVENGQMSLTYDKLLQLVRGLGLDFSVLFGDTPAANPAPAPVTARRSIGRAGDIAYVDVEGYHYGYLNTDLAHKKMTPIEGVTEARTLEEFGDLIRHDGEEFVYVLEGVLELHTEFYSPVRLKPGEHVYIDSTMGHAYLNGGEGACRFVCVCAGGIPEQTIDALRGRALSNAGPDR